MLTTFPVAGGHLYIVAFGLVIAGVANIFAGCLWASECTPDSLMEMLNIAQGLLGIALVVFGVLMVLPVW